MDEQLALPLVISKTDLQHFLTAWCLLEEAEDALREKKRRLTKDFARLLPLRGVLTAVKIVRATRKLEAHPKEAMTRAHLTELETLVDEHLEMESVTQGVRA